MPDHCPQQQVYRMYLDENLALDLGPKMFVDYPARPGFRQRSSGAKAEAMASAFSDKVEWYQRCYKALDGYDYLTRHLCDNVDVHAPSAERAKEMRAVCKEIFCDYESGGSDEAQNAWRTAEGYQFTAPGGPNNASCQRLSMGEKKSEEVPPGGPGGALLLKTLVVSAFAISLMVAVYAMVDSSPKLVEAVS
jgi:hypothetical protein